MALRPTLDKPQSKCIFISTPRGRNNWFAEFYNRGFTEEYGNWVSIRATYHENPRFSKKDIEDAKAGMSKAEFNQEYLADFNTSFICSWLAKDPIRTPSVVGSPIVVFCKRALSAN